MRITKLKPEGTIDFAKSVEVTSYSAEVNEFLDDTISIKLGDIEISMSVEESLDLSRVLMELRSDINEIYDEMV